MKLIALTCVVLVSSLQALGQVSGKSANGSANGASSGSAAAETNCGPIGCISANGAAVAPASGAPVVIRSTGDESTRTEVPGRTTGAQAVLTQQRATDFELFVAESLGHSLPTFGATLFRSGGDSFAPPTNVAPPADYVLGQGDEVVIRTVGKIDIDAHTTIDRNGQIFIPQVGPLTVAGMRLDQLTEAVRAALSKQFLGFDLSVSLGQLRSIQVFVLGQARVPGVYTVSSLSTLINTLFITGGPSSMGTLRDIQVRRGGEVISHFDVYRLLLQGDKSADVHLLPGDTIFIPQIGPQVAVDGNVGTPAIYELTANSTIGSILQDAGGLTQIADRSRAVLEHVMAGGRRSVEELALDAAGLSIPLQNGDILRVSPISPQISGAVTLRGNVATPGRYAWRPGLRVSDVIPNRAALIRRSYYTRQNALAPLTDDPSQPADTQTSTATSAAQVQAALTARQDTSATVVPSASQTLASSIAGSSPVPTTTAASQSVTPHDAEINFNYAVIERLDPVTLTTTLIPFALGEAIDNPSSPQNKTLLAGDTIVVYSERDVALPSELRSKYVLIDGQVKAPGVYRVGEDETLRDVVLRAGGLTPKSYLYAARLTRDSVKKEQDAQLQALVQRESREVLSPGNQRVSTSSTSGTADPQLELRKAYIIELSKIRSDGRVVLQLAPTAVTNEDVPAFALQDGDHFFVPMTPNTVDVLGSVYNQGALRFLPGGRARGYLNAAGGATHDADPKREFIIRADGTLVSRQVVSGFERLHLYPGDTVVVPANLRGPSLLLQNVIALGQFATTFTLGAVAIAAVR